MKDDAWKILQPSDPEKAKTLLQWVPVVSRTLNVNEEAQLVELATPIHILEAAEAEEELHPVRKRMLKLVHMLQTQLNQCPYQYPEGGRRHQFQKGYLYDSQVQRHQGGFRFYYLQHSERHRVHALFYIHACSPGIEGQVRGAQGRGLECDMLLRGQRG